MPADAAFKQPLHLLVTPQASFHHPFPLLITAEMLSSLVSNSSKNIWGFLLQSANFQAELPIKTSLSISTRFSVHWSNGTGCRLLTFLACLSREAANSCLPGTTVPRRHLIFHQTRNRGSWLCHIFLTASSSLHRGDQGRGEASWSKGRVGSRLHAWGKAAVPHLSQPLLFRALCKLGGEHHAVAG